jgi:5'-3' exonuclease
MINLHLLYLKIQQNNKKPIMGIQNLHRFLRKHTEESYVEVNLSKYNNKLIAIDTNVYLYNYKSIHKTKWLHSFFSLILLLKKYNIQCVFIYDSKAPVEKNSRKQERKERKRRAQHRINEINVAMDEFNTTGIILPILKNISEKRSTKVKKLLQNETTINREAIQKELTILSNQIVNLSRADTEKSKRLLKLMGIPYYDAEYEAETLCAHMCYHGQVDAVLSNDTDVLVYGTPLFLTKLNMKQETCIEMTYTEIIDNLKLSKTQFTDLCIMAGTDYNDNIPNIGSEKAYKLLNNFSSIEGIENEKKELDTSILNYRRIREIYSIPDELPEYNLQNRSPELTELRDFLFEHRIQMNNSRMNIINNMMKNSDDKFENKEEMKEEMKKEDKIVSLLRSPTTSLPPKTKIIK